MRKTRRWYLLWFVPTAIVLALLVLSNCYDIGIPGIPVSNYYLRFNNGRLIYFRFTGSAERIIEYMGPNPNGFGLPSESIDIRGQPLYEMSLWSIVLILCVPGFFL